MALNSVNIMGNLVADPEIRRTANNLPVANFRIAVARNFKNSDGEYDTDFFNCVTFGNGAEFLEKYFSKGDSVIVSGALSTNKWTDKNGNNRTDTNIVATSVYFGMKKANTEKPTDNKNKYKRK